jgi:hypothetical protein
MGHRSGFLGQLYVLHMYIEIIRSGDFSSSCYDIYKRRDCDHVIMFLTNEIKLFHGSVHNPSKEKFRLTRKYGKNCQKYLRTIVVPLVPQWQIDTKATFREHYL